MEPKGIVWILGAGFSKPLGAPLLGQLLTTRSSQRLRAVPWNLPAPIDPDGLIAMLHEAGSKEKAGGQEWEHAEEFLERLDLCVQPGHDTEAQMFFAWCRDTVRADVTADMIPDIRFRALRMLAAEICLFLRDRNPEMERLAPYVAWANALQPEDTVITFNYDRVIELVRDKRPNGIWVPTPEQLEDKEPQPPACPLVLKMHGSVDWVIRGGKIARDDTNAEAVLHCASASEMALATPGPTKQNMIKGGVLAPLWDRAKKALHAAQAIVFVGYRMPATDAYTKQWLVDQLRYRLSPENPVNAKIDFDRGGMPVVYVHTVLGPGLDNTDSKRLRGLLIATEPGVLLKQWDMGSEDFLGLIQRPWLLEPPRPFTSAIIEARRARTLLDGS